MGFLFLGLDSLIACLAVGAIVDRRWRLPFAAAFGIADAGAFLVGTGIGWQLSASATTVSEIALLATLSLYLLVVAASTQRLAELSVWVVPLALTLDNLAYGAVGDHSTGWLLGQAGQMALSSSLLAFVGLVAAGMLPRLMPVMRRPAAAVRVAGAALLLVTCGSVLLG
jgi:hypothetical protein